MKDHKTTSGKSSVKRACLALGLAPTLGLGIGLMSSGSVNAAGGPHGARALRWDLIHLIGTVISAGGFDSAKAADGSEITLTGSGTFLSTPGKGEPKR